MKLVYVFGLVGVAGVLLSSCSTTVRPKTAVKPPKAGADSYKKLLTEVVDSKSKVDYESLVRSPQALDAIYADVAARSPESDPEAFPTEEARFAYWLNAYNIAVLYGVKEVYPIDSVMDYKPFSVFSLVDGGGFFAARKYVFGGKGYSLYKLENGVIRKRFSDPRLHFALNCASTSCPDLAREPFVAERLDSQLEKQTQAFINSRKGVQIDHKAMKIRISAIFDWYSEDFEKDGGDALSYVEKYFSNKQELRKAKEDGYELAFLPYDWSLNRQ